MTLAFIDEWSIPAGVASWMSPTPLVVDEGIPVITLNCPLCGSRVQSPSAQPFTRLTCRKCHTPFHLSKTGSPVIGEPPDVALEAEELKQKVLQEVARLPIRKAVTWLTALLIIIFLVVYLTSPPRPLKEVAERAAQAFSQGDEATLKRLAAPGTAEDVDRWYQEVHTRLVQERGRWGGQPEVIEVHVSKEDRAQRVGSAGASIHPGLASGRDVTLANPTEATAAAAAPVDLDMDWVLKWWGGWKIDGRSTLAKLHPPS